jgi:hypothetical protein
MSSAGGFDAQAMFRNLGIVVPPGSSCFDYSQNTAILCATIALPVFFIMFLCFAVAFGEQTKCLLMRGA